MKIVVAVKVTPDTAATMRLVDGRADWGDAPLVLNPWDEFAVEAALQLKEAHGGSVTVVSVGDASADEAIRQALAMGCDEAVRIEDAALSPDDTLSTAKVLAAAVQKIGDVDLVLFGRQAVDGDTGLTPAQTARVLGWPYVGLVAAFPGADLDAGTIQAERVIEEGRQVVETRFPAVMSVAKEYGEPRYPSFMGIRKATRKMKQMPVWSLADLGIEAPAVKVHTVELAEPPKKEVVCEFIEGDSPEEIAEKLLDKLMAEKVL